MRYGAYEEVAGLASDQLRTIARVGDAQERVWAAWALGMRLGQHYNALEAADVEPAPGVRRHLIVMLAGFGESPIIKAFAEHDPDERVRATALVNLLRIGGHDTFVRTRFELDTSSFVRNAVQNERNYKAGARPELKPASEVARERSPYLPMLI